MAESRQRGRRPCYGNAPADGARDAAVRFVHDSDVVHAFGGAVGDLKDVEGYRNPEQLRTTRQEDISGYPGRASRREAIPHRPTHAESRPVPQ